MPAGLSMVTDVLKNVIERLKIVENQDEPDVRDVLFSLSLMATASINIVKSINNLYTKLLSVEKDHNDKLLELSKKVVYLSAVVSIGGATLAFIGKYLFGLVVK